MTVELPPWAGEDYECPACGIYYPQVDVRGAVEVIERIPRQARDAVLAIPGAARHRRPTPETWSAVEYLCHLRDVYMTYTVRLHRSRTEDRPALEPMLNDLRARRFRYNERNAEFLLDELAAVAGGFCEEVARMRPECWERVVTRLPTEERTARWLLRQAMHEGVHHINDIRNVGMARSPEGAPRR